uniref:RNase H type-1 domain-containing protein n=1 Tax=Musca domestica TaxID=7370 RepID=A0A1I8NJ18_MUSDO
MILQEKVERLKNTGHTIWATDASVSSASTGCAVCNISYNQNFLFKIPSKMSSIMGELHAINKAIDIIIEVNINKATIITDSKNACLLLTRNTTQNYLANNILRKVNNSTITQLTIIWTPSHIGIPANERADFFAKHAAQVGSIIQSDLSVKDAHSQIYQHLWNRHWYAGSNMPPGEIKLTNRLFTGHTYGKTYLFLINAETSNLCDTCNTPNTENHQLFVCPKLTVKWILRDAAQLYKEAKK